MKEFIVTTDLNEDGTPKLGKDGSVKRSFSIPKEGDWTLIKKKQKLILLKATKQSELIFMIPCCAILVKNKGTIDTDC